MVIVGEKFPGKSFGQEGEGVGGGEKSSHATSLLVDISRKNLIGKKSTNKQKKFTETVQDEELRNFRQISKL